MQAFAYMLECADGTLYTGWTLDLRKRVAAHNAKRGAKYTRARTPVRLVYAEQLATEQQARRRECEIKRLTRAEKLRLIAAQKEEATEAKG